MMKIAGVVAATALLLSIGPTARADQPDFVGLSFNGTCKIGTCPPSSAQPNHGVGAGLAVFEEPIDFTQTLPNGDRFHIVGVLRQSDGGACEATGTQPFSVQYVGNEHDAYAPSQEDKIVIRVFHRWQCAVTSSPRGTSFSGVWGGGIANRSSASWVNAVGDDTTSLTAGPHFAPASFSDTRQFTAPVRGGVLMIGPIFTLTFTEGSKPGSFIALSGAPSPIPAEPIAGGKPASSFAGTWIGSNFPTAAGHGGAQTEMVIHQDGNRITVQTHDLLLGRVAPGYSPNSDSTFVGTASESSINAVEQNTNRCSTQGKVTLTLALSGDGRLGGQTIATAPNCVGTVYWLANAADPKAVAAEQAWMSGTEAFRDNDVSEAMRQFLSGAELGSAASMFSLARLLDGPATSAASSPNHARAQDLYREAAAAGYKPALHYQVCNSPKVFEAVNDIHSGYNAAILLFFYAIQQQLDRIAPGAAWKIIQPERIEVRDLLVNPFAMSDTDFACTFEMRGSLEIEPPDDAPNPVELRLALAAFNQVLAHVFYADSYVVTKNPDHSCTIRWAERTFGGVSVPAAMFPVLHLPLQATIPECW